MIVVGIAVGILIVALTAFVLLSRGRRMERHGVPFGAGSKKGGERIAAVTQLVSEINKRLPVRGQGPWALHSIEHGLSLWEYRRDDFCSDETVRACCATLQAPVQDVLSTLVDHSVRIHWDSAVKSAHTVAAGGKTADSTSTQCHDVVAVVPKTHQLFSLKRSNDAYVALSRTWQQHAENEWAWMLWQNLQEPVVEDATWSFILVSPLREGQSAAVYVACMPMSLVSADSTVVRLAGFRQYIECQYIANHIPSLSNIASGDSPLTSSRGSDTPQVVKSVPSSELISEDAQGEEISLPSLTEEQQEYVRILHEAFDDLILSGLGGIEDGWSDLGKTRGVTLMQKAGEGSVNCVKGTGVIRAPAELLLDWIDEFDKVKLWDNLFQEGRYVERLTEDVHVDHLIYKAQWPTSARDFCVVAGRQKREDGTWLCGTRSIVHPACPPLRSCVRGTVIEGGYVLRPLPDSSNSFEVTYVTKVDLKGNIPSLVANKVSQNAPMCVATLRDLVQRTYADQQAEEQRRQLEEEALTAKQSEGVPKEGEEEEEDKDEDEEEADWNSQSGSNMPSGPVSDQALEYPMVDPAHVDYRTLGNQAAAGLLAELLLASDVDVYQPKSAEMYGGWKYDGVEKNVVILKKQISSSENYFMGKGIIPLPVSKVWAAIHEPRTRFAYDPMLKELQVIEDLGGRVMIIHMLLQAQQCLLKQARDFCFLHTERIEQDKHIVAAQSVEHSNCPEVPGVQRGVIHASGWCVEPIIQDGAQHSMVTYLGRVDVKGPAVPGFVVDYVRRQQTLNVANLAKYLQAFTVPVSV